MSIALKLKPVFRDSKYIGRLNKTKRNNRLILEHWAKVADRELRFFISDVVAIKSIGGQVRINPI